MNNLPPLTCSYLALVSASKLATSSFFSGGREGEGAALGSSGVATAVAAGADCCTCSSGSLCCCEGERRGRDCDLAMMALRFRGWGKCGNSCFAFTACARFRGDRPSVSHL